MLHNKVQGMDDWQVQLTMWDPILCEKCVYPRVYSMSEGHLQVQPSSYSSSSSSGSLISSYITGFFLSLNLWLQMFTFLSLSPETGKGSTWELGEKTVSRSCFGPHVSHGFFQALVFNIFWHRQTETAGFHQFGIKTSSVRAFPCDLFAPTCTCECILELEHWLEWDTLLGYHVGQNVWGRVDDLA